MLFPLLKIFCVRLFLIVLRGDAACSPRGERAIIGWAFALVAALNITYKRRIKSHLPFAGIIRSSPYSPRFQGKG